MSEGKVTAHIKYKNVEQTFTGNVDDVWVSVNKFFSEMIPALEVARKVVLTVDFQSLIEGCKDIIAVAPEGAALLVPRAKLTDSETLSLHLLATHIGYKLGLLDNGAVSKEELRVKLGKSGKITSTRLGELNREGWVTKTSEDNYKITTIGIKSLQREVLPRIRAKI
ncbi:hypothetical protein E3J74_02795 [Candidatus Bathyarchaeota archaeon]|nr:MAG: hypothetical protein E3J74_02795 [Candidatus Bathyarchaeota archaeon]